MAHGSVKGRAPRSLCHRDVPRRAHRVDAEVRVRRLVARPYRSVTAYQRRGTRVEALRARDPARRQRPARIRVDRCKARAPGECVEQVRQRRRVEAPEVDGRERAGAERVAHRAHAREVAQPAHAGKIGAAVKQVVQVQVRERGHVGGERRASEVLAVRRTRYAVQGREPEPHVLTDGADSVRCHERARGVKR